MVEKKGKRAYRDMSPTTRSFRPKVSIRDSVWDLKSLQMRFRRYRIVVVGSLSTSMLTS